VTETLGQGRVGENNGVWKARWTSIREGKREWGKRRRTPEESIRSTIKSVRKTPINYDKRNFAGDNNFLYRRREERGGRIKGRTE